MRLTSSMRSAFIRSVMDDVPRVAYDEQITKLITDDCIALLPEHVRVVWKDKATRPYLETHTAYGERDVGHWRVDNLPATGYDDVKISKEARKEAARLCALDKAQSAARDELENKIKGAAYAFSTRKALAEALPEFEKYLPVDEPAASRMLPVLTNVVTDFMKAGWPKDKVKKGRKAVAA